MNELNLTRPEKDQYQKLKAKYTKSGGPHWKACKKALKRTLTRLRRETDAQA